MSNRFHHCDCPLDINEFNLKGGQEFITNSDLKQMQTGKSIIVDSKTELEANKTGIGIKGKVGQDIYIEIPGKNRRTKFFRHLVLDNTANNGNTLFFIAYCAKYYGYHSIKDDCESTNEEQWLFEIQRLEEKFLDPDSIKTVTNPKPNSSITNRVEKRIQYGKITVLIPHITLHIDSGGELIVRKNGLKLTNYIELEKNNDIIIELPFGKNYQISIEKENKGCATEIFTLNHSQKTVKCQTQR